MCNILEVTVNSPVTLVGCRGIDPGWADIYSAALPCQFIYVTGIAAGDYTLLQETNVFGELPELHDKNNWATFDVTIP